MRGKAALLLGGCVLAVFVGAAPASADGFTGCVGGTAEPHMTFGSGPIAIYYTENTGQVWVEVNGVLDLQQTAQVCYVNGAQTTSTSPDALVWGGIPSIPTIPTGGGCIDFICLF